MSDRTKSVLSPDTLENAELALAAAAALSAAGAPVAAEAATIAMWIKARPTGYWNNTGVYKPKGISLVVRYVGGLWRSNPYWGPTDGAGNGAYHGSQSYLRPGAAEGCLVGKIGGDQNGGGSETFALGNFGYVPPQYEGLLWLSVNDEPVGFGDNSGEIKVSIDQA